MDYTKLVYFYTVAKHSHMTRAAEELHLAQPALTKAIHALEEELGCKLFARRGRGITLTRAGAHLMRRFEPILGQMERLSTEMTRFSADAKHTVRIKLLAASTFVTEAVVAYRRQHTQTRFELLQSESAHDCHITVSTCHPSSQDNGRKSVHDAVFREEILLAVPRNSPYAALPSVSLNQIREESFVSLAGSRGFRSVCDAFCRDAGFSPHIAFESDSILAVRNFIDAELGVGFWPAFTWGEEQEDDVVHISIKNPTCARMILLNLQEENDPSPAALDFYRFLRATFARASGED